MSFPTSAEANGTSNCATLSFLTGTSPAQLRIVDSHDLPVFTLAKVSGIATPDSRTWQEIPNVQDIFVNSGPTKPTVLTTGINSANASCCQHRAYETPMAPAVGTPKLTSSCTPKTTGCTPNHVALVGWVQLVADNTTVPDLGNATPSNLKWHDIARVQFKEDVENGPETVSNPTQMAAPAAALVACCQHTTCCPGKASTANPKSWASENVSGGRSDGGTQSCSPSPHVRGTIAIRLDVDNPKPVTFSTHSTPNVHSKCSCLGPTKTARESRMTLKSTSDSGPNAQHTTYFDSGSPLVGTPK
mmetsp:Transcript_42110/g.110951  ORF Transcript_42110/g.110951 Transcript_42110/m.110951 type:complete len:302 (+) Transcript_42110:3083-3988(+)